MVEEVKMSLYWLKDLDFLRHTGPKRMEIPIVSIARADVDSVVWTYAG